MVVPVKKMEMDLIAYVTYNTQEVYVKLTNVLDVILMQDVQVATVNVEKAGLVTDTSVFEMNVVTQYAVYMLNVFNMSANANKDMKEMDIIAQQLNLIPPQCNHSKQ